MTLLLHVRLLLGRGLHLELLELLGLVHLVPETWRRRPSLRVPRGVRLLRLGHLGLLLVGHLHLRLRA